MSDVSLPSADQRREHIYTLLTNHAAHIFRGHSLTVREVSSTRVLEVLPRFRVLEIGPGPKTSVWTYLSHGAWEILDDNLVSLEFAIIAPHQNQRASELLAMLAYYHCHDGGTLGVGHTVPIGEPWLDTSACDHLLICHPYPYGPAFEHCVTDDFTIHLLWALPITEAERNYKRTHGLAALERRFDAGGFKYWDPRRPSVV